MGEKNKYGQYMTPNIIADFMCTLVEHDKTAVCLEPSAGKGIFLSKLEKVGFRNILGFEIDKTIINPNYNIRNESFVTSNLTPIYDVIIGNPPYIRWKNLETDLKKELENSVLWKNYCNSLCDYSSIFILKSAYLLKEKGELIFITPDYWFTTTHAKNVRNYLIENGYIKEIYHFNETPIFDKVKVSFVIFKYVKDTAKNPNVFVTKYLSKQKITEQDLAEIKNKTSADASFFDIPQFKKDEKWILVPNKDKSEIEKYETACNTNTFGDFCHIGNGMVSGLDKAFQIKNESLLNEKENKNSIKVLKAKDLNSISFGKITKYIFLKQETNEKIFQSEYPNFSKQLAEYKTKLKNRYSYGRDLKYWEWAFLRNFNLFKTEKERIFCPCKERITKRQRFRFSVVPPEYFPTQDVTALLKKEETKEDIRYIAALLNSKYVFKWLSNKGTRKGDIIEFSEKPISSIPYRKINFSNKKEVQLHDKIVSLVNNYSTSHEEIIFQNIDECFEQLFIIK